MGGWARLQVSEEFLRTALHLPDGTEITDAAKVNGYTFELIVTHPDIPPKAPPDGELIQIVNPIFRKQEPIVFEGWNPE